MDIQPRSAVVRFLLEARDLAGGTAPKLADFLAPELGYRPADKTVGSWLRGERTPDLRIFLALVRLLHQRGLSLDLVALAESDDRPLGVQVRELRDLVIQLHDAINLDRANRKLPPVEIRLGEKAG